MSKLKKLFETPRKAVITIAVAVAALAVLGTTSVYAASAIAESSAIGAENAQNFAFADAGVDPVDATNLRTEFEFELGQFVYEVEFTANGTEYDYLIKASDGTVLKKEVEIVTATGSTTTATATITLDEAKAAALADAGLEESAVTFTKQELDVDNGISVYDIEFVTADTEYEYEINAETGAIYSKSRETLTAAEAAASSAAATEAAGTSSATESTGGTTAGTTSEATTSAGTGSTATASTITLDEAKAAALADAGLDASSVTFTKGKLDYENGVQVYDIEFYTASTEYEYEINAATGAVYSKSTEAINNATASSQATSQSTAYIGIDSAKEIAAQTAGFSVSELTFKKAKLERDDGIMVYEIEFYKSGVEYEVTINATTGAVLEYDIDRD